MDSMGSIAVPRTLQRLAEGEFKIGNVAGAASLDLIWVTGNTTVIAESLSATLSDLADYTTLAEFTGTNYFRKTVTGQALLVTALSATSFQIALDFDNYTIADIGAVASPGDEVVAALLVVRNSASDDSLNWPLFVLDQDAVTQTWTPDGRDIAITVPVGGMALFTATAA